MDTRCLAASATRPYMLQIVASNAGLSGIGTGGAGPTRRVMCFSPSRGLRSVLRSISTIGPIAGTRKSIRPGQMPARTDRCTVGRLARLEKRRTACGYSGDAHQHQGGQVWRGAASGGDGNRLAVIDSQIPGIKQGLGRWRPADHRLSAARRRFAPGRSSPSASRRRVRASSGKREIGPTAPCRSLVTAARRRGGSTPLPSASPVFESTPSRRRVPCGHKRTLGVPSATNRRPVTQKQAGAGRC